MASNGDEVPPLILPEWADRMDTTNREWVRLNDVCSEIVDCPHSTPTYTEYGDFFIARTQDFRDGMLDLSEAACVDSETFNERTKRVTPRYGDLIYSREGAYHGIAAEIPEDTKVCLGQRTVLIRPDTTKSNFRFLRYWLSYDLVRGYVAGHRAGSAAPRINLPTIRGVPVALPPLPEQKAIASILGALDDKIELNRRMNATLEAMARVLFQSWFVDFDPVRAKLDGRPPTGLDPETAALFPATFQDSSLGRIPQGWQADNLGKVIAAVRERIGDSDAVVLSAVARSELIRSDEHFNKQVYSKSISNYLKVRQWDFAYNPSRINIGSVGMLKEDIVGAVSPVYEVFRTSSSYHWFVERVLTQPDTKGWIQTLCSGSVRQSLKLKDLSSIKCVIPPPKIVQAFNEKWAAWYELIRANTKQSRSLATLRDTLQPKLLSGEVSVPATTILSRGAM